MNPDKTSEQEWEAPSDEDYLRAIPSNVFRQEEIDIIVKCIDILTNERYVDKRSFVSLTNARDKSDFIAAANKLKTDQELNAQDAIMMMGATAHVAVFPVEHHDEVQRQFDVKLYQLYWLSTYIEALFEDELKELNDD